MRIQPQSPALAATLLGQAAEFLAAHKNPAISAYELAVLVFLRIKEPNTELATKAGFAQLCGNLLSIKLLTAIEPVSETRGYLLFGKTGANPAEVLCSLDPFAFISHLSAMEYHGLTDRFPKILYITRPAATQWRNYAQTRMAKDLGGRFQAYLESGLPKLIQPKISRFGQTAVHVCERSHMGAFRHISGSPLRVATIGRVFLEMIREPAQCGGIQHVIDIYKREAQRYLNLIVDEINQHGLAIDKVRAGYLLSEVCKLNHPAITDWLKFAQRGGSRKLDPDGEYAPDFSDQWKLSLNVPSLI